MQLYYHPLSPIARKVLICAHQNGLTDRIAFVPGDRFTLGEAAVAAALVDADVRLQEDRRPGHPGPAAFFDLAMQRPSLAPTAPVSAP